MERFCPKDCEFTDSGVPAVCQACVHQEDIVYTAPVEVKLKPDNKPVNLLGKNGKFYYTDKGYSVHESRVVFKAK